VGLRLTRSTLALALLLIHSPISAPAMPPTRHVDEPPPRLMIVFKALANASREFGVSPRLAFSVAWNESTFNPTAQSRDPDTHQVIARGLMQISKEYQDELVKKYLPGMHPGAFEWRNPVHSARLGCAMLAGLTKRFGTWGAVCAFNCGDGRLLQLLKHGRRLPKETENYWKKVLQ